MLVFLRPCRLTRPAGCPVRTRPSAGGSAAPAGGRGLAGSRSGPGRPAAGDADGPGRGRRPAAARRGRDPEGAPPRRLPRRSTPGHSRPAVRTWTYNSAARNKRRVKSYNPHSTTNRSNRGSYESRPSRPGRGTRCCCGTQTCTGPCHHPRTVSLARGQSSR